MDWTQLIWVEWLGLAMLVAPHVVIFVAGIIYLATMIERWETRAIARRASYCCLWLSIGFGLLRVLPQL